MKRHFEAVTGLHLALDAAGPDMDIPVKDAYSLNIDRPVSVAIDEGEGEEFRIVITITERPMDMRDVFPATPLR